VCFSFVSGDFKLITQLFTPGLSLLAVFSVDHISVDLFSYLDGRFFRITGFLVDQFSVEVFFLVDVFTEYRECARSITPCIEIKGKLKKLLLCTT